jgi:hypothetical protein
VTATLLSRYREKLCIEHRSFISAQNVVETPVFAHGVSDNSLIEQEAIVCWCVLPLLRFGILLSAHCLLMQSYWL